MKEQNIHVEYTRSELDTIPDETDWERVDAMTDEDIDVASLSDSDDPPTDEDFWKDGTVVMPENFVVVEPELFEWFKVHAKDYEAQINAVLRSYVEASENV
jgi:uncharacterized protein (DUF4415 family)